MDMDMDTTVPVPVPVQVTYLDNADDDDAAAGEDAVADKDELSACLAMTVRTASS
jgi:hypothetical protein